MSTELGKQILSAIKQYVATHVDRVCARVEQISASVDELRTEVRSLPGPQKGEPGERGEDGHTPTAEEIREIVVPLIPEAVPGPAGVQGERGEKGDTPTDDQLLGLIRPLIPAPIPGDRGERGERGADGRTPSVEELREIIVPLIPSPITGERGQPGERGERGEPGERGVDGRTPSADELREIIVPLIPAPIPGERGLDGRNGRDGKDGADGRDASQLEVLPSIDESRSYPRGTYARHAGGFWRSFESTVGMRGWECIVEGIAEETEELQDDGRTIIRRTVYSSGRVYERSVSMAVVLDRGVYKAGTEYAPGDAVTWAGCIWIAQRRADDSPYGKPATAGSGWRLAVKAGRDGRP